METLTSGTVTTSTLEPILRLNSKATPLMVFVIQLLNWYKYFQGDEISDLYNSRYLYPEAEVL